MAALMNILLAALLCRIMHAAPVEDSEMAAYKRKHPEEFGKYFEGDMIVDSNFRSGIINKTRLWPKAVVPYVMDEDSVYHYDEGWNINKAIAQFSRFTCVRWVRRTWQPSYVKIHRGDGCSSVVGMHSRDGVPQPLSLDTGCLDVGTIMHEMLHAIGFVHEQSRMDRDDYVTIHWENIEKDMEYNFQKYTSDYISLMDTRYDYDSILHYGPKYFSKNGLDTVVPKKAGANIGQRNSFSMIDLERVNKLYCNGRPG